MHFSFDKVSRIDVTPHLNIILQPNQFEEIIISLCALTFGKEKNNNGNNGLEEE